MVSNEEIKRGLEIKKGGKSEDDTVCPDCDLRNIKSAVFCKGCGKELYPELKKIRDEIKFSGLSPAETMYLFNNQSNMLEMIKVTFLDMINRNVLDTSSREVTKGVLIKKDKIETFIFGSGTFYDILKPHEEVFQKAMNNKPELTLEKFSKDLIKKLGKFTYKQGLGVRSRDFPNYRNQKIRDPMVDNGYLEMYKTKSLGIISRNNYELSDYGSDLKNKIEALFVGAEDLGENVENNPQRTDESSDIIGTRMFLLKPEDEIILNKFSEELHKLTMRMINKNGPMQPI
jgi:hypothetical protein